MATIKPFGAIFASVQETVKTSSGSAVNIVICLVTVGSEQLFSFAAFNCPCPGNSSVYGMEIQPNFIYGWVFIVVPAFALFILGIAMNQKTWKLTTGCCQRSESAARGYSAGCLTLLEIFTQALVAPAAWSAIAFLDGQYYACAKSKQPFQGTCVEVLEQGIVKKTSEFERYRRESQIVGWVLIAGVLFVGSAFYMIHRCMSPLTYQHRRYARWYRELEAEAFERHAKEQIKKEVEKETVKRFLQKKRNKHSWDKIATVFNFIRDRKNFALYSRLDEWNEDHKKEPLMEEGAELRNEPDLLSADDSCLDPLESKASVKTENETREVPGDMTSQSMTQSQVTSEEEPLLINTETHTLSQFSNDQITSQKERFELKEINSTDVLPNGKLKNTNYDSPTSC